jgi:hypothetical protein
MRSFKRARRPDFCLEFQSKFLFLFPRSHKKRQFTNSFFSGNSHGSRLRIACLPTGDSIKIDTLRFDAPDAPPIEGDPKELLKNWMKRLALSFDLPRAERSPDAF